MRVLAGSWVGGREQGSREGRDGGGRATLRKAWTRHGFSSWAFPAQLVLMCSGGLWGGEGVGWWWAGGALDRAQALGPIPHHQLGTCKRLPKGTPVNTAENRGLGGLGAMVDSLLWFSH